MIVHKDCRHFMSDRPCTFHKKEGIHCDKCDFYDPVKERILIIKLGAIGDVIRTTPLLRKLRREFPNAEITWITYSPEVLSENWVDNILEFNLQNIIWLNEQSFDWLINLDKDKEALALCSRIKADKKSGFCMDNFGKCKPISNKAEKNKWLTGLWDDLNKSNKKNYMEEIFGICGYKFNKEKYILEKTISKEWDNIDKRKKVIGLNTGCGNRWTTRLWRDDNWIELATLLKKMNYEVIILGGSQENERNIEISKKSDTKYLGYFELPTFIDLIDQCDFIVTQVTMAMHIAIGLNKTLILMNNIFNRNEFFLYSNGCIIEPELNCLGCFKQNFDERCTTENCMNLIDHENVFKEVNNLR
jgi:heptosyltransferase-2